jgi:hypothetical protein
VPVQRPFPSKATAPDAAGAKLRVCPQCLETRGPVGSSARRRLLVEAPPPCAFQRRSRRTPSRAPRSSEATGSPAGNYVRSPTCSLSCRGSYPRKAITLGRKRVATLVWLPSQFQIVETETPSSAATSSCKRPRSILAFRGCSPRVSGCSGYPRRGILAVRAMPQNGHAGSGLHGLRQLQPRPRDYRRPQRGVPARELSTGLAVRRRVSVSRLGGPTEVGRRWRSEPRCVREARFRRQRRSGDEENPEIQVPIQWKTGQRDWQERKCIHRERYRAPPLHDSFKNHMAPFEGGAFSALSLTRRRKPRLMNVKPSNTGARGDRLRSSAVHCLALTVPARSDTPATSPPSNTRSAMVPKAIA